LLGRGVISRVLFPFGILFIYITGENEKGLSVCRSHFGRNGQRLFGERKKKKGRSSQIVFARQRVPTPAVNSVVVCVRLQQKRIVCLRLEKGKKTRENERPSS
jgi:hypothetical protein